MINKLKKFILLNFVLLLASCGTMQSAFENQKKNNTDEFLVEKKSPLVMPPDYNDLPMPDEKSTEKETNDIKSLISKSKGDENKNNLDKENSSFEGSILKKIKNN